MKKSRIIIAGAGPVGVVSALACAQYGYAVTLLEAEAQIDGSPRAATTYPSTLEMIAQTINNKKRLEERDPKARQARFDELRATAENPAKHKEFLLRTSLIASVRKARTVQQMKTVQVVPAVQSVQGQAGRVLFGLATRWNR